MSFQASMQNMVKGIQTQSHYSFTSPMERLFWGDLTLATNPNEMVHFKEALPGWEHISPRVLGGADEEFNPKTPPTSETLPLTGVFQHCECHSYYVTRWQILSNEPQHIKGKNNIFSPWEGLEGPSSCRCQLILFCQEDFNLELGSKSRILTTQEVEIK